LDFEIGLVLAALLELSALRFCGFPKLAGVSWVPNVMIGLLGIIGDGDGGAAARE
jgi:hypothetical protein